MVDENIRFPLWRCCLAIVAGECFRFAAEGGSEGPDGV